MAKRFTETEKWKDKWFRSLRPEHKLAWLYMLDNCDHAGVIELDEELANFQIGIATDFEAFFAACEGRIARLENGKMFLVKFIEYQYGKLSADCRPHIPVIQRLQDHGIELDNVRQKESFKHGNVTEKRRLEVFQRDAFCCCYCGGHFKAKELQPDHLIPKTKGGTDSKDNLVAACVACNSQKSDKDFAYYVDSLPNSKEVWQRVKQRVSQRVFNTLKEKDKEQDKEQDKDKDKDKEGVQGEKTWTIPAELDTPEVRDLLGKFSDMRRRIKKPIKDLDNSSLILKRFDSVEHLVYALETCIANEYQGLKPDYRPPTGFQSTAAKGNAQQFWAGVFKK